jgi:hypothetical protein
MRRLLAAGCYGLHDRHQLGPKLRKQRADRSRRHAFVGIIDTHTPDNAVPKPHVPFSNIATKDRGQSCGIWARS